MLENRFFYRIWPSLSNLLIVTKDNLLSMGPTSNMTYDSIREITNYSQNPPPKHKDACVQGLHNFKPARRRVSEEQ